MAGRPTLSRTVEVSARLLELEATSNNANSRQASQRAVGSGGRACVGGERTAAAAAWGKREDAQQQQSNSGHPGLGFVLGCIWGISERREWTAEVLGG